jgi:pimeloyl-ACP methyl ester carboxylesterase
MSAVDKTNQRETPMTNVQELVSAINSTATSKEGTEASTRANSPKELLSHDDVGTGRFFKDQTYHHAVLRALNHVGTHGADISEVLQATTKMQAGDEQNWFVEWTALGDRNMDRARSVRNRQSRGEALLRAHTYYARAQFYLPWNDPKRPPTFDLTRKVFYEGLDTLGVAYEKIDVPYGANQLKAVYYPAANPIPGPLIVFCGGFDSIVEELYFFLAASATSRGYSVLTFDGPGQGAPLREQGLHFTHEWEKPTSAVLDAFLANHSQPAKIVLIGMSMGGYLAPRAAAFEPRIDGVVSYDIGYDMQAAFTSTVSPFLKLLQEVELGSLADEIARFASRSNPNLRWVLSNAHWTLGSTGLLEMLDAVGPYTLDGVADLIRQDVLILAGAEDQFIPLNQVEKYQRALVNARSITTKVYDRASGGQEHSQIGAPTLWQADFFDWIEEKFGTAQSLTFERHLPGTGSTPVS